MHISSSSSSSPLSVFSTSSVYCLVSPPSLQCPHPSTWIDVLYNVRETMSLSRTWAGLTIVVVGQWETIIYCWEKSHFLATAVTNERFLLGFWFVYSQIWLNLLMDDCHFFFPYIFRWMIATLTTNQKKIPENGCRFFFPNSTTLNQERSRQDLNPLLNKIKAHLAKW